MNESHAHTTPDEVMDVDQLSLLLRTNKAHLYELSSAGIIPATKVGRQWLYVRSVIIEWLKRETLKEHTKNQPNKAKKNNKNPVSFSQFQAHKNVDLENK